MYKIKLNSWFKILTLYAAFAILFAPVMFAQGKSDVTDKAYLGQVTKTESHILNKDGYLRVVSLYPVKGIGKNECGGENCSVSYKTHEEQGEHLLIYNKDKSAVCQLKFKVYYTGNHVTYYEGATEVFVEEYLLSELYLGAMPFEQKSYKILGKDISSLETPYCKINQKNIKVTFKSAGQSTVKGSRDFNVLGQGYAAEVMVPVSFGKETKKILFSLDPSGQKFADEALTLRDGIVKMRHYAFGFGKKPKYEAYVLPAKKSSSVLEMQNRPYMDADL